MARSTSGVGVCAYLRVRTSAADTSKIQQAATVALDLGPARQASIPFFREPDAVLCVQSQSVSAIRYDRLK